MKDDIKRLFEIRVGVYNVFRHFFCYGPDENNIQELSKLVSNSHEANKFSKELSDENLVKLKEEYTRLFIGPGKVPISLYETAYRQPDALLMQDTTVNLRNQYLASGRIADGIVNLPEDHLAMELEFMYSLATDTVELFESDDLRSLLQNLEKQRDFIHGRTDWIASLVPKVDDYSQCLGINAVFHVLQNFIEEDIAFIGSIIEQNVIQ